MAEVIKSIRITTVEVRDSPSVHIVYKIDVQGGVRGWSVYRRYSEFYRLNASFLRSFPKQPLPYQLPPKIYSLFSSCRGIESIEERREGLARYLKSILDDADSRWRDTAEWRGFLDVPKVKNLDLAKNFTSESWLDEVHTIKEMIRQSRTNLLRRDNHYSQQEVAAAHNLTFQVKKEIALLNQRLNTLKNGLAYLAGVGEEDAVISEWERTRRGDKLNKLSDEISILSERVAVGAHESPKSPPATLINRRDSYSSLRTIPKKGSFSSRVFGNAKVMPKDVEETSGLDSDGLINLQQQMMQKQNTSLEQFSEILKRQLRVGALIGQELDTHNQLLSELSQDVDVSQSKMKVATKRLERIR
ncbi:Phox-like protein [Basidiobolus meristosporus CBS 931.73]|uniref:Phox-like protein n=1 Tax=Basidiobolus meristosporus CBS 931.73 TaxID=1314790 RepID=A0A1Y1YU12_9FUNG|nr:Phox-like protein [Basidiobolus meristosporus CBS 931.73]|eukprot:ORY01217.1 Phox-like protein [Basidiobolus meristosporus CBS 931.73]